MVSRFDVFLVNLDPTANGDAKNTRPAVILSPDEMNRNIDHVIVAPLSSSSAGYPTRVSTEFLNAERFIILDQMMTIDRDRLVKKIGELDERTRPAVLACLAEMFAE